MRKKKILGEPSTISKIALFRQWTSLMNRIKPEIISKTYYDTKQLAEDYQTAKIKVELFCLLLFYHNKNLSVFCLYVG